MGIKPKIDGYRFYYITVVFFKFYSILFYTKKNIVSFVQKNLTTWYTLLNEKLHFLLLIFGQCHLTRKTFTRKSNIFEWESLYLTYDFFEVKANVDYRGDDNTTNIK